MGFFLMLSFEAICVSLHGTFYPALYIDTLENPFPHISHTHITCRGDLAYKIA
jgi:hypothetical protein